MRSRQDGCRDGNPGDDHDTSLDAYVARLVDEAPPLTSEQRDILALLLRRASGRPPGAGDARPDPVTGAPVSWLTTAAALRPDQAVTQVVLAHSIEDESRPADDAPLSRAAT